MLHEVMTGLYMSVPDEGGVTIFGADDPMKSFYADADFFGFSSDGELVLLTTEILDTPYQYTNEADMEFNGATVMKIYDARGDLQLRILELVRTGSYSCSMIIPGSIRREYRVYPQTGESDPGQL
jgi:hypothetical protein